MYYDKKKPLAAHQIGDPLLSVGKIDIEPFDAPTIFGPGASARLTTWGRDPDNPLFTPHWIGVRGSTPLHTDPRYPRYTHQLVVFGEVVLLGLDGVEYNISVGSFITLDTHSPHQLKQPKGKLYAAASIDAKTVRDDTLPLLKSYIENEGKLTYE